MPLSEKSQGIVLRKRTMAQQDVVVVFFTQDRGKLSVLAKGLRSGASKRSSHVQTGNVLEVMTRSSQSTMPYLESTSLISAFQDIKSDMYKMKYVYACLFILDKILPELVPEEQIYKDTLGFMTLIHNKHEDYYPLFLSYLKKLLSRLGYQYDETRTPLDIIEYTESLIDTKIPLHDII